jgi:flagellar protein FlaJ
MYRFVPLGVAVALVGVVVATIFSERLDRSITRTAFLLFSGRRLEHNAQREQLLRSAAMGVPYREYATKTRLYAVVLGGFGAVIGFYLGIGLLVAARSMGFGGEIGSPFELTAFSGGQLAVVCLVCGVSAALSGVGTYGVRWWLPSARADARKREIDAGLPRLVAFTYALTRGGMSFPGVLRTVSRNEGVFGEGASEVGVAVRNIDLFNVDLVTATKNLSDGTPSEQFRIFSENLSSVLQSGGNLSVFLHEQYERYRDEAEEQQAEILNVLATTAEVYVTVVVAGMLFLVTILLIIGLTTGDTLFIMRVLAYAVIPGVNLLFLAYLLEITQPLRSGGDSLTDSSVNRVGVIADETLESDGGYLRANSETNHQRLFAYRRIQSIRETLAAPIQSLLNEPKLVLYVTVPIAVLATAYRLPEVVSGGGIDVRLLDDLLVQAAIFLMGTFAMVYEYSNRRLRRLEASVPEFLERLASLNESGISVVSSFDRVRRSDIGELDNEIDRIWRDIKWGATVEGALFRFEARVRTSSVTRVVTLITNAMKASNEIGPVLRIAAEQARSDLQLRRRRRQEMFTYLVVVYISFLVFLIVIAALEYVLIPSLPDMSAFADGPEGAPGIIGDLGGGDRDAYQLVFFHTALIQSTLSGLVGGVMGKGSIKDGMKHATVMLTVTYLILTFLV